MADAKTAWDHLMEASPDDARSTMKSSLNATFEGTYTEYLAWMEATFKTPGDLRVVVRVGEPEPSGKVRPKVPDYVREIAPPPPPSSLDEWVQGKRLTRAAADTAMSHIRANNRNRAIKTLRDATGCPLQEAVSMIDSLTPHRRRPTDEEQDHPLADDADEIPF